MSKVQKKGDIPKVKDNSFFEEQKSKDQWDIQVVNEDQIADTKKELTVTLGQNSNVNMNIPVNKINKEMTGFNLLNIENLNQDPNDLYEQEKGQRGIYYDDELHTMFIYLIFSLILTPQKGTLDDLYCCRYPIEDGKPPVLHYLHYHLNHPSNQSLIPMIYKKVIIYSKFYRLRINFVKILELDF